MSIRITSAAQWLRCIHGTTAEHHAALYRLVRLLAGDASHRPPPPISLPGRPAMPTAPPAPPPTVPLPTAPMVRYFRQALPTGKTATQPSTDADARDPYSRDQLERMNARFVTRLEHAIAHGKEQPHA